METMPKFIQYPKGIIHMRGFFFFSSSSLFPEEASDVDKIVGPGWSGKKKKT